MPVLPENRGRYPRDWATISWRLRVGRAGDRCECEGLCGVDHAGRCPEEHLTPARSFRGRVVLTCAHLDHVPENCSPENLRVLCQACHNRYDAPHRRTTRRLRLEKGENS